MRKWGLQLLRLVYVGLIATLPVAAIANYQATVGSGTNFGSIVIGGVNFASMLFCDATVANQCAAVSAGGAVSTTVSNPASGYTSPISAASGAIASAAIVDLGAQADAACGSDAGTCSLIALAKRNNQQTSAPANIAALATGGCTPGVILTAVSNNATVIGSAAAHTLCELSFFNTTTSVFSVRLYDTATAPSGGAPCNSATGVVANYVAQSNATSPGFTVNMGPFGKAFANGIVVCITGANANNDTTNAATGGNLNYAFK